MYGPTEITTACTSARIPNDIPVDRTTPYPIGFPATHCGIILLDDEGVPVQAGDEGLLHVSGPSVFAGYWNRPAETAASIVEFGGVRWYNTGDVARWHPADGYTYLGRKDGQVKRKGFRIELGEIEQALYRHPRVAEAAVVAVSEADGTVRIAAFLVWNGAALSTIALKTFCATTLPAYMSPDVFVFARSAPANTKRQSGYASVEESGDACQRRLAFQPTKHSTTQSDGFVTACASSGLRSPSSRRPST